MGKNWRLKGVNTLFTKQQSNFIIHVFFCWFNFTASNLKKIIETVNEYYSEVQSITLTEEILPNVMRIAEKDDPLELDRFLQLILGKMKCFRINFKHTLEVVRT